MEWGWIVALALYLIGMVPMHMAFVWGQKWEHTGSTGASIVVLTWPLFIPAVLIWALATGRIFKIRIVPVRDDGP